MVQAAKIIGTGLATTGLIGAGVGIGAVFGALTIVVVLFLIFKVSFLLVISITLVIIIIINNSDKVKKYIQKNKICISAIIALLAISLTTKLLLGMFDVGALHMVYMIFVFHLSSLFLITRMMLKEKTVDRWFIIKFLIFLMLPILINYMFSYIQYNTGAITLILYEISLVESLSEWRLYIGGGYNGYSSNQHGSNGLQGGGPGGPQNNSNYHGIYTGDEYQRNHNRSGVYGSSSSAVAATTQVPVNNSGDTYFNYYLPILTEYALKYANNSKVPYGMVYHKDGVIKGVYLELVGNGAEDAMRIKTGLESIFAFKNHITFHQSNTQSRLFDALKECRSDESKILNPNPITIHIRKDNTHNLNSEHFK